MLIVAHYHENGGKECFGFTLPASATAIKRACCSKLLSPSLLPPALLHPRMDLYVSQRDCIVKWVVANGTNALKTIAKEVNNKVEEVTSVASCAIRRMKLVAR